MHERLERAGEAYCNQSLRHTDKICYLVSYPLALLTHSASLRFESRHSEHVHHPHH